MLTKLREMAIVASVLVWSASATAMGVNARNPEKHVLSTEVQRDVEKLQSLSRSAPLDDLEKTAAKLESKWFARDKEQYGYVILRICDAFTSHRPPEDRPYELARQHTLRALEKSADLRGGGIPIEIELRLVTRCLQENYEPKVASQDPNWSTVRGSLAAWYFHAWDRLEKGIDPNYDPNSALRPWPMPSKYDGIWVPGMSPDAIKDPAARAAYAGALKEFWARMEDYNEQHHLRRLKEGFQPKLAEQILRLYSGPSFDSQQLEAQALIQDLQVHVADAHLRESILDAVKQLTSRDDARGRGEASPQNSRQAIRHDNSNQAEEHTGGARVGGAKVGPGSALNGTSIGCNSRADKNTEKQTSKPRRLLLWQSLRKEVYHEPVYPGTANQPSPPMSAAGGARARPVFHETLTPRAD